MTKSSARRRTLLTAFAFIAALTLFGAAPASAHMGVATSNPGNGSTIENAPEALTVTFSVAVDLDSAAARVRYLGDLDTPVSEMNNKDVRTDELTRTSAGGEGTDATFDLPELAAGLYAIDWSVAEIGGHTNSSVILFKVTGGQETGGQKSGSSLLIPAVALLIGFGFLAAVTLARRK